MRDCANCQERAGLHPEYAAMDWDEIPCSDCEISIEEKRDIPFTDDINIEKIIAEGFRHKKLIEYFVFLDSLTPMQRAVAATLVNNPNETRRNVAKLLGISRQRLYVCIDVIKKKYKRAYTV